MRRVWPAQPIVASSAIWRVWVTSDNHHAISISAERAEDAVKIWGLYLAISVFRRLGQSLSGCRSTRLTLF